jgi:hypothetical protein
LQRRKAYIRPVNLRDSIHDRSSYFHGILHHNGRDSSSGGAGPPGAGIAG